MKQLENNAIVVTGAGAGIGATIAQELAKAGARVAIADINLDAAAAVARQINESDGVALALQMDVTNRESTKAAFERAAQEFGQLEVVFNNAGISQGKDFLDITPEDWNKMMNVNGLGTLIGMQEAARIFIRQGNGGKIINTTSVAARQANATFAHYAASKAVVSSLIQSGARSFAAHNITVMGFAPGIVVTDMWRKMQPDEETLNNKMAEYSSRILRNRVSTPEDIAPTAVFLAGPGSDYMTGQVIMIDGGMALV